MRRRGLVALTTTMLLGPFGVGAVGGATAEAVHVATPTVRDITMATITTSGEREFSIAVDPANPNRLMAGSNQRPGSQSWFASSDGGRSWTNGALPNGTLTAPGVSSTTMSDPSLAYGNDGTLYYAALMHGGSGQAGTLFVTTTGDQGANWTDPASGVVAAGATGPVVLQDKEHIAVDLANNNVYVAWTPIGGANDQEVVFSSDAGGVGNGLSFGAPAVLTTDAAFDGCLNQGADLAQQGAGGRLYLAWTSFCSGFSHGDAGTVYVTSSDDGGGTWSAPVAVMTIDNVDFTAQGFRSRSHPSIDVDPATGRVFVTAASNADTAGNDDAEVLLSSSTDGAAWTGPQTVNTDPGGGDEDEQWMPWVAVGQGRVTLVYYCWDDESANINACFAYAPIGASPAFTEIVVSSAVTPTGTGFLGDYNGNFVGSDEVIHPVWGDGRPGNPGDTDAHTARVDFSPPTAVAATGPASKLWGENATFDVTVTGAHGEAEQFIPVAFTVSGGGSPSPSSGTSTTDASGEASFTFSNSAASSNSVHVWADLDEDGIDDGGAEAQDLSITWEKHPTTTEYTGPSNGTFSDPVTFSGTLEDAFLGTPVAGETLDFSVGADGCSGATDGAGAASCSTALTQPGGSYSVVAAFAGSGQYDSSSDTEDFEILKETTVTTYTGPTVIADGMPATLSAVLTEDDGPAVVGRTVDLTLGSGASAQSCSGVTGATGAASCTIATVAQPLGPGTVTSAFAGDAYYLPSSDTDATLVFAWTTGGNFVIGDGNAAMGAPVTFWGSEWYLANAVSGGAAPEAFKGFSSAPAGPTGCGGTWSTSGGNSPPPPASVPEYTAVLVTGSVSKSGNVISGTKPMIVVVQVDPGYAPAPGHVGTGQVVAVYCS